MKIGADKEDGIGRSFAEPLKAVLFDFDGTLTRPGLLDFEEIKRAMLCPPGETILEYIESLPSGERREHCNAILESFEMAAAENAEPNDGAEDMLEYLKSLGLALGILTRNSRKSVVMALDKFKRVSEREFSAIITREDVTVPKPDPEGVLLASWQMNVPAEKMLMVGDYCFDIEAGRRAGARTVFLDNGLEPRCPVDADFRISGLNELRAILCN